MFVKEQLTANHSVSDSKFVVFGRYLGVKPLLTLLIVYRGEADTLPNISNAQHDGPKIDHGGVLQ